MKNLVLLALSLLLIGSFSCAPEKPAEEQEEVAEEVAPKEGPKTFVTGRIPDFKFTLSDLQINQHMDSMDLRAFKHYGEFFTEDFSVFRLDRIDFLAEAYFIDDINLYFIDSLLVRVQAYLREDRSNDFIRRYGKASIAINDYHNKELLETEDLLIRENGRTKINSKLDRYTIKWNRQELDISYHVNKKNDTTQVDNAYRLRSLGDKNFKYMLTFQAKNFNDQMAWVKWEGYKKARGL